MTKEIDLKDNHGKFKSGTINIGFGFKLYLFRKENNQLKRVPAGYKNDKFVYDENSFYTEDNDLFKEIILMYNDYELCNMNDLSLYEFIAALKCFQNKKLEEKKSNNDKMIYSFNNFEFKLGKKDGIESLNIKIKNSNNAQDIYINNKYEANVLELKITHFMKQYKQRILFDDEL